MLAQMSKTIAGFFVFVYFDLYYTESCSLHGGLFEGGGIFVRKQLEGGGLIEGA